MRLSVVTLKTAGGRTLKVFSGIFLLSALILSSFFSEKNINHVTSEGKAVLPSLNRTLWLGSRFDTVWGRSRADFMSAFAILPTNLGEDLSVDSLVLSLQVSSVHGDSLYAHHLHVYELTDTLYVDSTYFYNTYH